MGPALLLVWGGGVQQEDGLLKVVGHRQLHEGGCTDVALDAVLLVVEHHDWQAGRQTGQARVEKEGKKQATWSASQRAKSKRPLTPKSKPPLSKHIK